MQNLRLSVFGNVGQDATVNIVNTQKVINFSVAANESYKDKDGNKVEKTTWVRCAIWRDPKAGQETKIVDFLKKGQPVYIEGTPSINLFTSTKTGKADASFELRVTDIKLIGGKKEEVAPTQPAAATTAGQEQTIPFMHAEEVDNDLPF